MDEAIIDINSDLAERCNYLRRIMRKKLIAIGDSELTALYYQVLLLSEHEAARRAYADIDS